MNRAVILIILVIQIKTILSDENCINNIDITDGVRSGTNIIKDGITYTPKDYFLIGNSTRGCICNIKKCVRKCCLDGETMDLEKKMCVPSSQTPFSNFSVYSIIVVPENRICQEVQTKVIIDEQFTIVEGVLIWEDIFFALDDYCLTFEGNQSFAIGCIEIERSFEGLLASLGQLLFS